MIQRSSYCLTESNVLCLSLCGCDSLLLSFIFLSLSLSLFLSLCLSLSVSLSLSVALSRLLSALCLSLSLSLLNMFSVLQAHAPFPNNGMLPQFLPCNVSRVLYDSTLIRPRLGVYAKKHDSTLPGHPGAQTEPGNFFAKGALAESEREREREHS